MTVSSGWRWAPTITFPSPIMRANCLPGSRRCCRRQRGTGAQPPHYFLAGKLRLIPSQREVTFDGKSFELTTCEFDLLEALLRSRDTVATKDDLSLSVLGRRREPYDRSIDVHVSNLRKKLSAISARTIEIETVRAVGYRLKAAS